MLRSYVSGSWFTASDEGRPLYDAVTGDVISRISSEGVDMGGALAYGRQTGGSALRELTFHQPAAMLKALASYLREHRAAGPDDHGRAVAAEGHLPARVRHRGRPARPPDQDGPRRVHRLGVHRAAATRPPRRRGRFGPVQRRGRFAELLDPRPGRGAR